MDKTILISLPLEHLQALIIDSLDICLKRYDKDRASPSSDRQILTTKEAAEFIGVAVPTLYAMTSRRMLPHAKRGKRLFFSRNDLIEWIAAGKISTTAEMQSKAKAFRRAT